jgi:hypothetical protein
MNWFLSLHLNTAIGYVFFGSILFVACIVAGIDAWFTFYHKYRMSQPDEFQDRDDPHAISIPHYNAIDRMHSVLFQDVASMHAWLVQNVPSEERKVQLYLQAIIAKEKSGFYGFSVELSSDEISLL